MTRSCTWVFTRGPQRLEIRRLDAQDGPRLEIAGDGQPRVHRFADLANLALFQSDMEAFLLKTGWTFVEFSPERRRGRDRRTFPRLSERRRWWTDGLPRRDQDHLRLVERPRRRVNSR